MKEQLISLETAKLAKEKLFKEKVINFYAAPTSYTPTLDSNREVCDHNSRDDFPWLFYSAPTQSLLQRWLREVHNIHIKIDDFILENDIIVWDYEIVKIGTDLDAKGNYVPLVGYSSDDEERNFKTYEEALEQGLLTALKSIK